MGIRKTHFPCRKPFETIRLSHFSRIRLCRVSHSLPGATTEERGCGRLLLTSPGRHTHAHTWTGQLQKARSMRSIRYVFKAFVGLSGRPFIFRRISDRRRICLFRCAMRDSIARQKTLQLHPLTRVRTKITVEKKKRKRSEVYGGVWIPTTLFPTSKKKKKTMWRIHLKVSVLTYLCHCNRKNKFTVPPWFLWANIPLIYNQIYNFWIRGTRN